MDLTALRVEGIRQEQERTRFAIELRAREHLVVLAVALTVGATATLAWLANQVGPAAVGVMWASVIVASVLQGRALRELALEWDAVTARGGWAIEKLIAAEGEAPDDGEEPEL